MTSRRTPIAEELVGTAVLLAAIVGSGVRRSDDAAATVAAALPALRRDVTTTNRTIDALRALGLDTPVAKVTDYLEIASYGIMSTSAHAVDDQVVLARRMPSTDELADLVRNAAT